MHWKAPHECGIISTFYWVIFHNFFADGDAGALQQKQQMMQAHQDEQMAREMEALEADIVMVNELFTTIATYVHDQGEIVDSIEAHTEVAYVQVILVV